MTDRERFEEWAKLNTGRTGRCTEPGYTHQYQDSHTQMAWIAWGAATKAEREACAKVCENLTIVPGMQNYTSTLCAAEIRMRSNAELTGRASAACEGPR